jgi:hypothetical protein
MVTRGDTRSQTCQGTQSTPSNIGLSTLELHDFSDLRSAGDRPDHLLRWVIAVAAVLTVCHFAFNPSDIVPIVRASIGHMSSALL